MGEFIARCSWWLLLAASTSTVTAETPSLTDSYACRALKCSTLIPARSVDDPSTNDCGYRNGNAWWVDYVAGSLAWSDSGARQPITVALFDDGVDTNHPDLRNQLWINP